MRTVLSVDNIKVSIKSSEILHGISLTVKKGEVVNLVGRNGAGKTTTLRAIMGFLKVNSGRIEFLGQDITNLPPYKIARMGVGYSPEDSGIFELSTEENIEMATWMRESSGNSRDRIDMVYSIFPVLEKYRKKKGTQLSGGERKMLSLARAFVMEPKLLLLDEPFEGLSPAIIPEIQKSIKKIAKMGTPMLISESNVDQIPEFADRVYVIERGEIIFEGSIEELHENRQIMEVITIC